MSSIFVSLPKESTNAGARFLIWQRSATCLIQILLRQLKLRRYISGSM